MLFGKKRVEEDLERIRRANLPAEKLAAENKANNINNIDNIDNIDNVEETILHEKLALEKNDVLAMILAVFSLILPYVTAFVAVMGLILFLIYRFFA